MTMTLLRFIVWGFLMLCWLCLISLIIYSCSLCSWRQTVRDKVSLMWGLCCFPYCKMWNMLQLLVSVTLAEAPISLRRCAAYLVPVVLWVVFCCTGFPYQHSCSKSTRRRLHFPPGSRRKNSHHVNWYRIPEDISLTRLSPEFRLQELDKALLLSLPHRVYSDPSFAEPVSSLSLSWMR